MLLGLLGIRIGFMSKIGGIVPPWKGFDYV
jgi:hypothetical protein